MESSMSDAFVQDLLNAPGTKEALAWLNGGGEQDFRSIGELETNEESISLVELIYTVGATKVLAVEIDEFAEGQNTGKLVIQLPDNDVQRQRLFAWAGAVAEQQGLEPEADSGQRYLFLMLD
jgi:hypothetical protein